MNKSLIILGIVVAGSLLFQFNAGKIGVDDIVQVMEDVEEIEEDEDTRRIKAIEAITSRKIEESDDEVVTEETEMEEEEVVEDEDLTILAFGDMMMGRYVRTLMNQNGMDYPFRNVDWESFGDFQDADVVFGNLEGPILGEGRSGGTSMVFSFNEDIAGLLKSYGFNVLSIANNHAFDQGEAGREATVAALEEAEIGWCGHPTDVDTASVHYLDVGEKKVGFVCFDDVKGAIDDERAVGLIKSVRESVDFLIVSVHWGYEYKHKPDWNKQVEPGRAFVDVGADLIIGHHPHVVQSFEIYNDRVIFYSLGNFVFDQYWSQMTQEQLAIGVVLDDADEIDGGFFGGSTFEDFSTKIYLYPMKSEMSQPRLMNESERAEWIERFIGYGEYSEEVKAMIWKGVIILPDQS